MPIIDNIPTYRIFRPLLVAVCDVQKAAAIVREGLQEPPSAIDKAIGASLRIGQRLLDEGAVTTFENKWAIGAAMRNLTDIAAGDFREKPLRTTLEVHLEAPYHMPAAACVENVLGGFSGLGVPTVWVFDHGVKASFPPATLQEEFHALRAVDYRLQEICTAT